MGCKVEKVNSYFKSGDDGVQSFFYEFQANFSLGVTKVLNINDFNIVLKVFD